MGEKAFDIFQGSDWTTHRVTVAQAFDTLDRIGELCHSAPVLAAMPSVAVKGGMPRFQEEDGKADILSCIIELCDDLSGECDAVEADLFPYLQADPALRWLAFEMRLHLKEMREVALEEQDVSDAPHATLDVIMSLVARMRDLLRQIDQ